MLACLTVSQVAEVRALLAALADMQRSSRGESFAETSRLADEHARLAREADHAERAHKQREQVGGSVEHQRDYGIIIREIVIS